MNRVKFGIAYPRDQIKFNDQDDFTPLEFMEYWQLWRYDKINGLSDSSCSTNFVEYELKNKTKVKQGKAPVGGATIYAPFKSADFQSAIGPETHVTTIGKVLARSCLIPKVQKVNFTEYGFNIEIRTIQQCDERMEHLATHIVTPTAVGSLAQHKLRVKQSRRKQQEKKEEKKGQGK